MKRWEQQPTAGPRSALLSKRETPDAIGREFIHLRYWALDVAASGVLRLARLLSLKIPRKTSAHVRDGMIRLLSELPPELVRSVTPDRGKEFAKHDEISAALNNVPFFFPPPHAPWMRGTNENTNGLIREYCPKSTDLECFDSAFFTAFTSKINLRPRKCLGWRSPFEVFFNQLLHLT